MPRESAAAEVAGRTSISARLREQRAQVIAQVAEPLACIAEPYRQMPDHLREEIVGAYLDALADAIVSDSVQPFVTFLDGIDAYWAGSGLDVADVIRGVHVLGEVCRTLAAGDAAASLIDRWVSESAALVAARFVAAVNDQLSNELVRHRENEERLLGLQRVSAAVHSELDLDSVLALIVEEAKRLMGASGAVIRLVDDESGSLRVLARSGRSDLSVYSDRMPVEGSLSGLCFRTGRSVISNDMRRDPRLSEDIRRASSLHSLLIVPLVVRDTTIGVVLVSDREGGFSQKDERLLSLFAGQAAAAIEHARLYQQAQRRIGELDALQRVSRVISSSLDIDQVFGAIHQEISQVMPADALLIGLSRPDGLVDLDFIVDGGERYAPRLAHELSPQLRQSILERQPVVIGDVHMAGLPPFHTVGHPNTRVRSVVVAPMIKGDQVVGLLSAQSYRPYDYNQADAQLLMTIANHAVVAIEHARLYAQAQHLAVVEERNRLAREIHDTLAQGLIGISLYLERLDLGLPADDVANRALARRALDLTQSNLVEARRSVQNLRAATLEGRTLLEALSLLAREVESQSDFQVLVRAPVSLPMLVPRVEAALFRVVQESLTNCRKHAGCSRVTVRLAVQDDQLELCIMDDGCGFDVEPALIEPNRFGLSSMRERVEQVGGRFTLTSRPDEGTSIHVQVPLDIAVAAA